MTTFSEWLDAHCPPDRPLAAEPTLAYGLAEPVLPGDCYEDGSIRGNQSVGHRINSGRVWLSTRQAHAAAYYGWRITGFATYTADGHELLLVTK